jgi:hypothetical protein
MAFENLDESLIKATTFSSHKKLIHKKIYASKKVKK